MGIYPSKPQTHIFNIQYNQTNSLMMFNVKVHGTPRKSAARRQVQGFGKSVSILSLGPWYI